MFDEKKEVGFDGTRACFYIEHGACVPVMISADLMCYMLPKEVTFISVSGRRIRET